MRKRSILIIGLISLAIIVWLTSYSIEKYAIGGAEETIRQAELLLVKKKPAQAIDDLKWLLKYDPENDKALFYLAQSYFLQEDYTSASIQFARLSKDSKYYEPAVLNAAMCYFLDEKIELAEEAFKSYLAEYPNSSTARTELQWIYFNQFRVRDAENLLKERLPYVEDPFPLLVHLLYIEFKPPIAQESIRLLKKINDAEPGQASILLALGYCYWKLGEIDEARALIEEVQLVNPHRIDSILVAADFYLELGELQKCEAILQPKQKYPQKIQKMLEKDDRWFWVRSRFQFQKDNLKMALEEIQAALKVDPYQMKYLQHTGMILQAMGQQQEAQQFFQKAKSLARTYRELYKIVSSGALSHPTNAICLQVSWYCEELGKMKESREWKKVAASFK
ncbi:tetratricopeptide repeat protein [uncultured Gimesia sp.]|uniref:tetratricopeptide repeat protein n=1 Tax=uncultured Gimesia sp. TaxID=1678688 RepID=UPI002632A5CF|nr:tetratricopeptide repeat protein [uncultured Gimesia sp.]